MRALRFAFLAVAVLASAAARPAGSPQAVPARPTRYATDRTGRLDAARLSALNERLAAFERQSSTQVLVYVDARVPPGTTLEEFANRAFHEWAIGQKDKDNGALFVAFLDDRVMRLEVGYGLEGAIPDARAKQITSDVVKPLFKQGDFVGGVEAGAAAVLAAARGEAYQGTGRTQAESRPPPAPPLIPFSAYQIAAVLGLLSGVVGGVAHRRHGWPGKLAHGLLVAALLAGLWIYAAHFFSDARERDFAVAMALLSAALLMAAVQVTLGALRKANTRPPAPVWMHAAGNLAGLAAVLLVLLIIAGRGPRPWMLAAVVLGALVLDGTAAAIEADSGRRRAGVIAMRLGFVVAGVVGYVGYRRMETGAFPMTELAVGVVALMIGQVVRSLLEPSVVGGSSSGTTGGRSSSWESSSSSSSWSSSSSSSDSSSSSSDYSGGGGDSGGGGSSDSW